MTFPMWVAFFAQMRKAMSKRKKNPLAQGLAFIRWSRAGKKARLRQGKILAEGRRQARLKRKKGE